MKKICRPLCLLLLVTLIQADSTHTGQPGLAMQPGQGCTVFYAAAGDQTLAGNNEDSFNPLTRVWFIPATDERFGWVYFGYDDLSPQGGLNDQGLFFDGLSVPYKALITSTQKPVFPGGPLAMIDEVMAKSTTVDEAVAFFDQYSLPGFESGQFFFGDRAGHSAIVEGDTIIRKQGSYQIATNFRLSENPEPPYPCDRYNAADERLSHGSYSIELFRQILDATHQDHYVQTVYSQVYDLKKGVIYLYLFHDFQNGVVLNLADELAKGPHMFSVASLFPKNQDYDQWSFQQLDQWRNLYAYKIKRAVQPASWDSLAGTYQVQGDATASPVRVFLENDQLYLQKSAELPLELYPNSVDTVFHPFYNNTELQLAFQRNLLGQVTAAQVKLVYNEYEIASYTLNKTGVLSDSQIPWLALLFVLIILIILTPLTLFVLVRRRRRAARKI
jgi:hypothetical protein